MPEEVLEQSAAPQTEEPSPEVQEEEAIEEAAPGRKKEEKKKNPWSPVLAALLLICLIAEVALAAYIGLTLYQNIRNQRTMTAQYEAYVAFQEEQRRNPPKVQYIGPTVRVVDGVLVDNYSAMAAARAQAENNIPGI